MDIWDYLAQQDFSRVDRFIQNKWRDKGASSEGLGGAIHGSGGLDKVGQEGIKESEFCLIIHLKFCQSRSFLVFLFGVTNSVRRFGNWIMVRII
jgi:hypothetical protein